MQLILCLYTLLALLALMITKSMKRLLNINALSMDMHLYVQELRCLAQPLLYQKYLLVNVKLFSFLAV